MKILNTAEIENFNQLIEEFNKKIECPSCDRLNTNILERYIIYSDKANNTGVVRHLYKILLRMQCQCTKVFMSVGVVKNHRIVEIESGDILQVCVY